jgi:ABC-2 type transport system ATP-binding protein
MEQNPEGTAKTMTAMVLEIERLTKEYRRGERANDGISLRVAAGEVFGLLGPNGAGKTTLVNQIIGLLTPTAGSVRVAGVDVVANPGYAREACSYQPQTQVPINGLTPARAIELVGRMRGGRKDRVVTETRRLLGALEMDAWAHQSSETLSGGVRRLTAFCMATVVPGQLVILDEPTNDIDPLRRRLLWGEVRRLAEGGSAVLLVTHNVLEAERAVDRLAVIDQGKVIGTGTPAELKGAGNEHLRLELILEPDAVLPAAPAFVTPSAVIGRRMVAGLASSEVNLAVDWARYLQAADVVEEYSIGPVTLEDIYVQMVRGWDEPPRPGNGGNGASKKVVC